MGQKVNPIGLRVGITVPGFLPAANKADFAGLLHEDLAIRTSSSNGLSRPGCEGDYRTSGEKARISFTWPAASDREERLDIEKLKNDCRTDQVMQVNIIEIRKPEIDAVGR
ncbi:hypothetical protein [Thalassospira alkalitolerans]|uniref:hypothetical protein n=1 Tax=Thalassospira alkalitolerans TaxID=1293890 RepID=UPI003AA96D44